MKGKLYLFAIGGTGARVLKSLIMMLASGVNLDAAGIVPVLVDLDKSNGSLAETLNLIEQYKRIHQSVKGSTKKGIFFETPLSLPKGQTSHALNLHVAKDGSKAQQSTLKEFIAYDNLGASNTKYLVDLLFSKKNLEDNLAVGFRGQPHIGAITFYNITKIQGFVSLCQEISPDDRVFFISSIFGGTGAAGFPSLSKIFRDPNNGLPNQKIRSEVPVGALLVLPYFTLEEKVDGEFIDSNLFMTKTKLALSYYSDHLSGYNAMYYLCEPYRERKYENQMGSEEQDNDAHFIELFGAKSIFHFASLQEEKLEIPQYFEYAARNEGKAILTFKDLEENPAEGQVSFKKQLTALAYIYKYFNPRNKAGKQVTPYYLGKDWTNDFSPHFFNSTFYREIFIPFLQQYAAWLHELGDVKHGKFALAPFNLDVHDDAIGDFIKDQKIREQKGLFGMIGNRSAIHFDFFNTELNNATGKLNKDHKEELRFLELLFLGISNLFEKEKVFN